MTDSIKSTDAHSYELAMRQEIAQFGVLYSETDNPVFIWLAIAVQQRERRRQRLRGLPPFEFWMPLWIEEYLLSSAEALSLLVSGVRVQPSIERPNEFLCKGLEHDDAMERVTAALGLTAQGVNAFKNYEATAGDVQFARAYGALQREGLRRAQILGQMSEDANKEQSVIRKRISRGTRMLKSLKDLDALHLRQTLPN